MIKHCHTVSQLAHAPALCSTKTTCNIICSCVLRTRSSSNTHIYGELKMNINIHNLYNKTHTSRNSILWFHPTSPPTCNSCFTSLVDNLKISLLPTYKPPLVEHMREQSLYRATTQRMLMFTLHVEPQLQEYVLSHNSINTPTTDL